MNPHKFALANVAIISTLALSGVSQATSVYHAASGEGGFTYHPDHAENVGPAKTRQQVIDEMRNESPEERRARLESTTGG
jgi:outer membrane protein assembly factor BamE (lipoprotein component of BamABCDE complex)